MTEQVNHPAHYNGHPSGVEAIDVIEHMTNYNLANAVKYLWRAENKGNKRQDAAKAIWYLKRAKSTGYEPTAYVQLREVAQSHPTSHAREAMLHISWSNIDDALEEAEDYLKTCDE